MSPTIKDDELPERRRRGDDDIAVLSSGHQEVLPPDKNAKRSPASIIVEAIRDFRIPSDLKSMYQKNDGPSKRRATSSPIWDYGNKNETEKRLFFCMASSTCRNPSRPTRIMYKRDAITAAVNHLREVHGIVGGKSVAVEKKKAAIDASDKDSKISKLYKKNPRRYWEIQWVNLVVLNMLPLSLCEKDSVRAFFRTCCVEAANITMTKEKAKQICVELYHSTRCRFKERIDNVIGSSAIAVIHLNLDLSTSKVSKENYVGVRIYFIDIYWGLNSYILAINRFAPSSDVIKGNRFSEILQMWLRDILSKFGIRIKDIAGSTSDGGSDVKRGMKSLDYSKLLERCIPHMTN
ncbi:hypothetical protein PsorP6_018252 [Peronosclerospora sorghi]|uniref:Uncharacterized protein n=1 Tax=Peronosclerospora sorghi TaxID=230839 RepID=A0ACC0WBT3_9STRA|nr:hypothetical protein PsorP6_018252 [Peronosclerospora sorghi]